ncbi:MAG: hotdog domain-containing protein [Micrococcus sp.]|nr:hotdog domain-containing protein [Micrococcus sp.]
MQVHGALSLEFVAESYTQPTDVAAAGTVITWIEKVGYAVAASWSGTYVRTSYVGNMQFQNPVPVDTRALAQSRVVRTDGANIHVQTRVLLPDVLDDDGDPIICTVCLLIYTAEEDGEDIPVRAWVPRTPGQIERDEQARTATEERATIEAKMSALPFPDEVRDHDELVRLRFVVGRPDTTIGAAVRASLIMRWIDEAASVCAARWSGREEVVAAFAGGVKFLGHIYVGEVVRVEALLVHTSARSMFVALRVFASPRHVRDGRLVAHSLAVMVAVDDGSALPVPQWAPTTEGGRLLEESSVELVALRSRAGARWRPRDVATSQTVSASFVD